MKYFLYTFLLCSTFLVIAQSQENKSNQPVFEIPQKGAKIVFDEKSYNFGEIKQGEVVQYSFNFKNTGNEPLVIADVRTTCGCTAPKWPKEAVAPGESASILVQFNSSGKIGVQNKTVTVISNALNSSETVIIKGNVVVK